MVRTSGAKRTAAVAQAAANGVEAAGPTPIADQVLWELTDALLRRELIARQLERGDSTRDGHAADLDQASAEVLRAREQFLDLLSGSHLLGAVAWSAQLGAIDAQVLAFLVAVELDPDRQRVVADVQGDRLADRPTLALLRRVFGVDGPRAVGWSAPLVRAGLVEVAGAGPWTTRTAVVPPSVVGAFAHDPSLDPDLPASTIPVSGSGVGGLPDRGTLVLLHGADRQTRLAGALDGFGGRAFLTGLPDTPAEWAALVRETTMAGCGLVVEVDDLSRETAWWLERADHLPVVVSSERSVQIEHLRGRRWVETGLGDGDGAAGADDWRAALGHVPEPRPVLNREQLRLVGLAYAANGGDLAAAVRRLSVGALDRLTVRLRPSRTWSDLVLPDDQLAQVRELVVRHRHASTVYSDWGFRPSGSGGTLALFAGPSGTGKTLAAEVVAGELGLDLFKLDISSTVSKYIGETEKNLEAVFSAAEAGDVVLFFDEADAVFGKRSEIRDSHDRYANLEVSYLLQRVERYPGMVILASNLAANMDVAFIRRIHVSVDFPMPDEPQRLEIWKKAFPPDYRTAKLGLPRLAHRFRITGGQIRDAVLGAAFAAADAGTPITDKLLVTAVHAQFRKAGRLVDDADPDPS